MCSVCFINSVLSQLWLQLGITVLVLAAIAGAAWISVRFLKPRMGIASSDARMKIIEKLPLEPRRSLYLVRIDSRETVVGVTEHGVSFVPLSQLDSAASSKKTNDIASGSNDTGFKDIRSLKDIRNTVTEISDAGE